MPSGDRTGPNGYGPLTGRGMGPCGRGHGRGYGGRYGRGPGFGRGSGYGRGRGCALYYEPAYGPAAPPAPSKEDETAFLKAELKELEAEKNEIEQRLKELEK